MKKLFSIKSILVFILVIFTIAGIILMIAGISVYEDPKNREFIHGIHNTTMDYEYEIKAFSYVIAGTVFIVTGLYLIVRLKDN